MISLYTPNLAPPTAQERGFSISTARTALTNMDANTTTEENLREIALALLYLVEHCVPVLRPDEE